MKVQLAVALAVLVSACASGTQMQAECESKFQRFTDIYRCTADAIAQRNPSILSDQGAKLYMLRGEQLARQVDAGAISDIDAKVAWQQTFVDLRSGKIRDTAAAMDAATRSAPAPRPAPAPINCTSQRIGDTVTTACH